MTKDNSTEEKILAAAKKIFLRDGLQGARMQDIADLACINRSMLHYYFRDKEMLSHQLLEIELSNIYMVVVVFDYHIPLHNSCVEKEVENIAKIFKEKNIKTVLCGKKASFSSPSELNALGFDFCISNDAEQPLLNILLNKENINSFDINNFHFSKPNQIYSLE